MKFDLMLEKMIRILKIDADLNNINNAEVLAEMDDEDPETDRILSKISNHKNDQFFEIFTTVLLKNIGLNIKKGMEFNLIKNLLSKYFLPHMSKLKTAYDKNGEFNNDSDLDETEDYIQKFLKIQDDNRISDYSGSDVATVINISDLINKFDLLDNKFFINSSTKESIYDINISKSGIGVGRGEYLLALLFSDLLKGASGDLQDFNGTIYEVKGGGATLIGGGGGASKNFLTFSEAMSSLNKLIEKLYIYDEEISDEIEIKKIESGSNWVDADSLINLMKELSIGNSEFIFAKKRSNLILSILKSYMYRIDNKLAPSDVKAEDLMMTVSNIQFPAFLLDSTALTAFRKVLASDDGEELAWWIAASHIWNYMKLLEYDYIIFINDNSKNQAVLLNMIAIDNDFEKLIEFAKKYLKSGWRWGRGSKEKSFDFTVR